MRALRTSSLLLVAISLVVGTNVTVLASDSEPPAAIRAVAGTLDVHQLPGGTFAVEDRLFRYRDYVMAGSSHHVSDPTLYGYLVADWNWDVQASGDRPVPAWGEIDIAGPEGTWSGSFSGIRPTDFQPVDIRAVLFGDGAYEGLCATLDISAVELGFDGTWVFDGVIHPVDMPG
jgi:hypothetical protein